MKANQKDQRGQKTGIGDSCLIAAEEIQRKRLVLRQRINLHKDAGIKPRNPLPIDNFLSEMVTRVNAPRVVHQPKRKGDHLWTESVSDYVYSGIERAFVKAGMLPGNNRAGYKSQLKKLKTWAVSQEQNPRRALPRSFVQTNAKLFAKGVLRERRLERIGVLYEIERSSPTDLTALARLKEWIEEDLGDERLKVVGRSANYQKITFAKELVEVWEELTGQSASFGLHSNFARFVIESWKSGFVGLDVNTSFKRVFENHASWRFGTN